MKCALKRAMLIGPPGFLSNRAKVQRTSAGSIAEALRWLSGPTGTAVCALGVTQIISWGTTLYALGVLGAPIAQETGWSRGLVFGGLTAGLLASGAASTHLGRWIDRYGARAIMSTGSGLAAIGLWLLSIVTGPLAYVAVWLLLGLAMRMTLYDAAFAALVQVTPSRGRRAISYLTLFGGFASSVFWPIAHWLNEAYNWRTTFLIFAAINLFVCLPFNWWGLARREAAPGPVEHVAPSTSLRPVTVLDDRSRSMAMALFGLVMSATAFAIGAMAAHLPAVLEATGLSAAVAVTFASIKGVAQVAGRIADIAFGQKLHPVDLGRLSIALLPLSFVVLLAGGAGFWAALTFTVLFGVANGLVTIVRGAVPLALFGPNGYGAILGILATPYLLMNALAPALLAIVIDIAGYRAAEVVLVAAGLIAVAAMELMAAWHRRLAQPNPP
jgi:MFS family permease